MDLVFRLEEINTVAKKLLEDFGGFHVFALHGEMGAGKTTFVHAVCRELGVSEHVSSPTFSLINQYNSSSGETIYHIDLYRLKDTNEAFSTGVEDCLFSGCRCFVEWPENAPAIFPENTLHIQIEAVNSNTRKLKINL